MKISVNIYDSLNGKIITLCDENLLGKELKDNNLSFKVGEFYYGELLDEKEVEKLLNNLQTSKMSAIHAIGNFSINLLKRLKIISKEDESKIKYIENVPILLIFYV